MSSPRTISLLEEATIANARALQELLDDAIATPGAITLDAAPVRTADTTAIQSLLAFGRQAARNGTAWSVTGAGPALRDVASRLGVAGQLPFDPSSSS